jgi:predicted nucleotidyltransferase
MYKTIEARKRDESLRRNALADIIADRLLPYARKTGGRYLLYGSLARKEARYYSDVDLLLDFPAEFEGEAWRLAENLCAELGIEHDIKPIGWCDDSFVARIAPRARIIG